MRTGGPRLTVSSERPFVESAQILTPEKSQGGRKAWHVTVTHPFGDHAFIVLSFGFREQLLLSLNVPRSHEMSFNLKSGNLRHLPVSNL